MHAFIANLLVVLATVGVLGTPVVVAIVLAVRHGLLDAARDAIYRRLHPAPDYQKIRAMERELGVPDELLSPAPPSVMTIPEYWAKWLTQYWAAFTGHAPRLQVLDEQGMPMHGQRAELERKLFETQVAEVTDRAVGLSRAKQDAPIVKPLETWYCDGCHKDHTSAMDRYAVQHDDGSATLHYCQHTYYQLPGRMERREREVERELGLDEPTTTRTKAKR